jgi:hypothetical protein
LRALIIEKGRNDDGKKKVSSEKANEHSFGTITIVLKSPKEIQATETTIKNIKQLSDFSLWMQREGKKLKNSTIVFLFFKYFDAISTFSAKQKVCVST